MLLVHTPSNVSTPHPHSKKLSRWLWWAYFIGQTICPTKDRHWVFNLRLDTPHRSTQHFPYQMSSSTREVRQIDISTENRTWHREGEQGVCKSKVPEFMRLSLQKDVNQRDLSHRDRERHFWTVSSIESWFQHWWNWLGCNHMLRHRRGGQTRSLLFMVNCKHGVTRKVWVMAHEGVMQVTEVSTIAHFFSKDIRRVACTLDMLHIEDVCFNPFTNRRIALFLVTCVFHHFVMGPINTRLIVIEDS